MMRALDRARVSLEGLSVADAFGEQLLHCGPVARQLALANHAAPVGRQWAWTDDTAMAISIVETLSNHGEIVVDELARAFGERYHREPARGYGGGAHKILDAIYCGIPYPTAARLVFDGQGSCGNGGGMRSAPVGAYFAEDLTAVLAQAARTAAPTHAHPDGVAGAVAVAIAAACAFSGERDPRVLLETVVEYTPAGATRDGLRRAIPLLGAEPITVAAELGNGSRVLASDTVPFAVWCAASHLTDYAAACWACASVGGDIDTTCAMVGGIVAGVVGIDGIPLEWRTCREPLPA